VCIVTGAARGIGRAIAEALLDEGAKVCMADLNAEQVAEVAEANRQRPGSTARDAVIPAGRCPRPRPGPRDDRHDRASLRQAGRHVQQCRREQADEFHGRDRGELVVHHGCQRARLPDRDAGGRAPDDRAGPPTAWGKIVNTASIASRQGFDNVAPYCASKWAVVSLTQSAARDLAKHNITVTGFAPGVVATEMWEQVDRDLMEIGAAERPGQAMEEFSSEILRGRVARPEDITGTTTFLASRASDYMTGQIVMIDGGMTLV
jgi:meso-butanediol dehydrogenase/(S,S)-butanediol dehydrogenase/diacetyl reductase